jgi:hypothetical protein
MIEEDKDTPTDQISPAPSSSGRISDFESEERGSNPRGATK